MDSARRRSGGLLRRGAANSTGAFHKPERTNKGSVLGKFALVAATCIVLFATFTQAQQVDVAVGLGTIVSSSPASGGLNFQPPAEKGGSYITVGADFVGFKGRRIGLNLETSFRVRRANYDNYETYRPILSDLNVLFQPRLGKKLGLDLVGGIGVASTRFNLPASCNIPGCINYTSRNHFMEDFGAGIRYYAWHNFFVRPEVRYYHIQNNVEFNSSNVFRVGVSIGYTIKPE